MPDEHTESGPPRDGHSPTSNAGRCGLKSSRQGGPGIAQQEPEKTRPCPNCKGFGRVRDSMHIDTLPCGRCDGKGVIAE